ncbi:MAG: N-acetylornithine carbamoyltransferase [Saprospiraceae bacterium]
MKQFTKVGDVPGVEALVSEALRFKSSPLHDIGKGKTLGLFFFNPSLRTRLSTQKAALNLGMNCIVMNAGSESWRLEMADGTVMDGDSQEHVKDAVAVMSAYCDIIGVRTFPKLESAAEDYTEPVLNAFLKYSEVPVVSLESATRHPLQSLADLVTIRELGLRKPKIAVTWAPHPKVLPQAVTNSFLEWVKTIEAEVVLAHPEGYCLHPEFSEGIPITHRQEEALEGAGIVYCKNWSSFEHYGQRPPVAENWTVTADKMRLTNHAKFMHCLPIRRNVVATGEVVDNSIVLQQAANREWAAQAVLGRLIGVE